MRRLLFFAGLLGCHGKTKEPPPLPPAIQVHDAGGALVAELRPLRPCRGSVGPVELIVGGPPLIAQVGTTRWSGDTGGSDTTLVRDSEKIARVANAETSAAVIDVEGVPVARITLAGTQATVVDAANTPLRTLTAKGAQIDIDQPASTVTGTSDLIIAALLASPEFVPEVRILAACERVLAPPKREPR